jgi:hypothetical protein
VDRCFAGVAAAILAGAVGCASRAPAPAPSGAASSSSAAPDAVRKPARFLPPEANPGESPYRGGDGSSIEKAVVILAPDEQTGVDLEYRWIGEHLGRFRKKGVGLAAYEGRHYDVFTVELPDGSEHTIYFDITSFLGKMRPR